MFSVIMLMNEELRDYIKNHTLLRLALRLLSVAGNDPTSNNSHAKVLRTVAVIVNSFVLFSSVANVLYKWKGLDTIAVNLIVYIRIYSKCLWFVRNRSSLLLILEQLPLLWPEDKFGEKVESRIQCIYIFMDRFIKWYFWNGCILINFYNLKSYMMKEPLYPLYGFCDTEQSPVCFQLYFLFQVAITYLIYCPIAFGFNVIFIVLVTHLYCGFELLEQAVINLNYDQKDDEKLLMQIAEIVKQHNVILRLIGDMNEVLLTIFQVLWFTCICAVTFCLYMMTYENFPPNLDHFVYYGFLYINLIIHFSFYCVAGSIIKEKAEDFSYAIYQTNWYYGSERARRCIPMIIQRANRGDSFTIQGVAEFELTTLLDVILNSYSLYTILNTIRSVNKNKV